MSTSWGTSIRRWTWPRSWAGHGPGPTWIRPKRPWMERFAGRIGGPGVSEGLLTEMERLLTGGLYYMAEPFAPNAGQRD